jgi:hypothetical protein
MAHTKIRKRRIRNP